MSSTQSYLVTGGAGFIGSAIVRRLLSRGHRVLVVDDLSTGFLENIPPGAEFVEGDASSEKTLDRLGGESFHCIFHIGGQSSGEISFENPERDLRANTLSTLSLLNYARRHRCGRIVYASTMSVYGSREAKEQFSETDDCSPLSLYAVGKLASEQYLRVFQQQYGVEYSALRYFNVYGPGQNMDNLKQGMISIYLKQFLDPAVEKVEVKGSLDRFRDFIYIDDVVDLTIACSESERSRNQVVNIGTGKKTSVASVLDLIRKILDSSKELRILTGTPGDQFGIFADNSRLRSWFQPRFVDFREGLEKTVWSLLEK